MSAYYNDNNAHCAAWLKNLIAAGLIADGDVDDRDIRQVQPSDLRGYTQVHLCAGIGAWSYALRLAGWPDYCPVWTASLPCQPFSISGKRKGVADDRHIWPEGKRLIEQCRPAVVFGEQVASPDGRLWLSGVRSDLEELAYAVGAADLCSAGVGAPHIRQRLHWVAYAQEQPKRKPNNQDGTQSWQWPRSIAGGVSGINRENGGLGNADSQSAGRKRRGVSRQEAQGASEGKEPRRLRHESEDAGGDCGLGNAHCAGLAKWEGERGYDGPQFTAAKQAGHKFWADAKWIECADGKLRRVEPGIPLLVDGPPSNVADALAGFGNAINPVLTAEFICAAREAAA